MKQTNNAIKFLMAQYRAIFKNAYFKGMATALVLTAGLAAGQAQAASAQDPIYTTTNDSTWTSGTSGANSTTGLKRVAGDYDDGSTTGHNDGLVSGSTLTVGANKNDYDIVNVNSGNAYGGYVSLKAGSTQNATADTNTLHIYSGGTVSATDDGNMVGGWAKTAGNGQAIAEGNQLIVEAGADISGAGQGMAAWASSLHGATATDNHAEFKGASGSTLTINDGSFGVQVFVDKGAVDGDYIARENELIVTHATVNGSTKGANKWLIGGSATTTNVATDGSSGSHSGAGNADSLQSIGNIVDLSYLTVGSATDDAKKVGMIAANLAVNNLSSNVAEVIADGAGKDSLKVAESTIYRSTVVGGRAENYKGGLTSAINNSVEITNSNIRLATESSTEYLSAIMGGHATTTLTDAAQAATTNVTASNNTITVKNTKTTPNTTFNLESTIIGGVAEIAGNYDLTKATASADNNTIEIDKGVKVTSHQVVGAHLSVQSGGATLSADSNKVVLNGEFTGHGDSSKVIAGAVSTNLATLTNNSVEVNGKVTGFSNIVGALGGTGTADPKKGVYNRVTGNSVTIGKDADVVGSVNAGTAQSMIYAAFSSNTESLATNNDVTVEGKVTDASIYGGAGADSVIALKNSSTTTYTSQQQATTQYLSSDVIDIAGTVDVGVNNTVKVLGYYANGKGAHTAFNTNQTTVANTATLFNSGTVELLGDTTIATGANLHALTPGALIKVNGDKDDSTIDDKIDTASHDIDVDLVGGHGQLNIALADLQTYLTADDTYTRNKVEGKDKAGAVELASGGVLHFTDDSVVVSNLDFASGATGTAAAGKIVVGTDSGDSIIKGQDLHVNHLLSSLGSEVAAGKLDVTKDADYTKLSNAKVTTTGLSLEAERLFLGATNLTQNKTAEITFEKATAKNLIDFSVGSGDYHLTAAVAGNNYMRTQDQSDDLDFFTGLTGSITGDVDIFSGGSLTIEYGHWTANDNITLKAGKADGTATGGGSLIVGIANTSGNRNYIDLGDDPSKQPSLPDATLTLGQELVVDLAQSGDVKISADGQQAGVYYYNNDRNRFGIYDADLAQETVGDDHHVLLDLSSGLTMVGQVGTGTINGKVTVSAVSGGVINLNGSDLSTILNQNDAVNSQSGAFFEASGHGVLNVAGNVEADFDDFGGKTGEENGIKLGADGFLIADTVQVIHEPDSTQTTLPEQGSYPAQKLVLGDDNGHLVVDDLVISDTQHTTKPEGDTTGEYASTVYFAQGTADIAKSLSSVNDTLILGDTGTIANVNLFSDLVTDKGTIDVNNLRITNGSLNVQNGDWTAQNLIVDASGDVVVGGHAGDDGWTDAEDNDVESIFTAQSITMAAGSLLDVRANGTMTVGSADFRNLAAAATNVTPATGVHVAGELTIDGDANATLADGTDDARNGVHFGAEGSIVIAKNGYLTFGEAATTGAIIDNNDYTGSTITLIEGYSKIQNNGGMLTLGLSEGTTFDQDAILALKNALFTTGSFDGDVLKDGGVLNIGNADFEGYTVHEQTEEGLYGYTAAYSDIKPFMDITNENGYGADVTNNKYMQTNITGIQYGDPVQGVWGSFSMATGVADSAQVTIAGNTQLHYAEGNKGFFISDATHSKALGAIVEGQKDLTLVGGGEIGKVSLEQGNDDAEKNLTVLTVQGGDTTIAAIEGRLGSATAATGIVGGTVVRLESNTTVTGDIRNIDEVEAVNGAQVTAQNARVNYISTLNSDITIADTLEFDGAVVLGGFIKAKTADMTTSIGGEEIITAHGGTFIAETLKANGMLQIGVDASTLPESDAVLEDGTRVTGTGYLDVGTLELNKATLFVDPEYDEATSVAGVLEFKSGNEKNLDNDVGTMDGNVWVGKNAAVGIGATLAETREAIASYQTNGALDAEKYGSILYLNGQLTVADDSEIALNAHDEDVRSSLLYTVDELVKNRFADLGLGKNTALLLTEKAFEDAQGNKTQTAITFKKSGAVVNGAGGDIVLAGDFDAAQKLNLLNDADNNGIDVKGSVDVRTQNGFLVFTLQGDNVGMGVQLEVDKPHAYAIMSEASDPVVETLISYNTDRVAQDSTQEPETVQPDTIVDPNAGTQTETRVAANGEEQPAPNPDTENNTQTASVRGYSSFLSMVSNNTHGAPAEAAARLAIYGGAVQAAMAATSSTTDAIAARMGVGNTANITMANNGQGAALWLAPVYKTHDSDSFDSQGLDYGVDLNLYGVALGADFEFMPSLKAGVMFNVGSGDADGQGNAAANNTSNDFDYWGAAIYGNYTYDALSVTADVSYTAVDNDLEATTGMDQFTKLESSTDTTAISLGVTAKYTFDLAGVEVAPHAGLRYTNIDLDDYSIKSNGETIADYNADKVNIFSIPVGVTFAKEFSGESWTVKPSLDLTLTGNFGDDDISGDVSWAGVDGLVTPVSSEYMDDFTYGATLGIEAASTSGFSLGLGVNYTGSSNVDEFGVNANARFVF